MSDVLLLRNTTHGNGKKELGYKKYRVGHKKE